MTNKNRPVNLDLTSVRLPITSYSSILHRISGLFIFLLIPVLLCMLDYSLESPERYAELQQEMSGTFSKLVLWALLSALLYHLVAGIRHLLMDAGIGESKEGGTLGAQAVLGISAVLIVIAGVWIW